MESPFLQNPNPLSKASVGWKVISPMQFASQCLLLEMGRTVQTSEAPYLLEPILKYINRRACGLWIFHGDREENRQGFRCWYKDRISGCTQTRPAHQTLNIGIDWMRMAGQLSRATGGRDRKKNKDCVGAPAQCSTVQSWLPIFKYPLKLLVFKIHRIQGF